MKYFLYALLIYYVLMGILISKVLHDRLFQEAGWSEMNWKERLSYYPSIFLDYLFVILTYPFFMYQEFKGK